jgi:hypothetical protein
MGIRRTPQRAVQIPFVAMDDTSLDLCSAFEIRFPGEHFGYLNTQNLGST